MRAVRGENGQISVIEVTTPKPAMNEVLVKVFGAGVNGADISQAAGHYPPPPGTPVDLLGLEFAGEVTEIGTRPMEIKIGDRVMGIVPGAGQAEYVTLPASSCILVPPSLELAHAGGIPETFITAYDALVLQAALGTGDRLCVQGATGGVGTAAIQIAAYMGAHVTAVARSIGHKDALLAMGANEVVAPDAVIEAAPFDVILELVGAQNLATNISSLAPLGRIAIIGVGAGTRSEIDLRAVMGKRARIFGSTLRARSWEDKAQVVRAFSHQILPGFASGTLTPVLDTSFTFGQANEAYTYFSQPGKLGKVLLTP